MHFANENAESDLCSETECMRLPERADNLPVGIKKA
jgi:hypothetical protein